MNSKDKVTIGFNIAKDLIDGKKVEYWRDLSALFSELSTHPKFQELKQKHPKAMIVLGAMP